ncbi:exodeoxyribonuclease VII small subunit [Salinimicrobium oceani]|uniref:Exodeoxyribonuclease VII small subunit n=1 Tax=Salinimicrobium oceani TaxID=2722702 RepID=A0ABX1CVJ3_9FLAO|nr:exodeoxyribonuclease VII small subunit [Salinimicrobium oceani]NJW51374.1 exodeoxyribonuclease VII small subunit [Salinimicrobium oceani]
MGTKLTYTEAFSELQQIVEEMENSQIGIDELDAKVKRASALLKICREKLFKTEQNVLETLKNIESGD